MHHHEDEKTQIGNNDIQKQGINTLFLMKTLQIKGIL